MNINVVARFRELQLFMFWGFVPLYTLVNLEQYCAKAVCWQTFMHTHGNLGFNIVGQPRVSARARARASCKRCGRASTDAAKLVTHQILSPLPETPFAALVRSLFGGRVLPTVFRKVHRLGDLGWVDLIRFAIFRHLAQLHSQFCQIPSCTSQIGQT